MGTEIERKFLVEGADWRQGNSVRLRQCYLNRDKHRTVRIRIAADEAFLTVKSVTQGATRAEFDVRVFAGLNAAGVDRGVDFNCRSAQEKGLCPGRPCPLDLRVMRQQLLDRTPA